MTTTPTVHQIHLSIRDIEPLIWRRVLVPSAYSLAQLHDVIQAAFGWQDCHLHEFVINGRRFGNPDFEDAPIEDERRNELVDVLNVDDRLTYTYDFGDGWEHDVTIEDVRELRPGDFAPTAIAGERACPPEDCGGSRGYVELLATLADPSHPEHKDVVGWLDGTFDPEDAGLENFKLRLRTQVQQR
jgi:hypothetical protein